MNTNFRKSVPPHTLEALDLYVNQGIPTGGFLQSVLSNDLMGSFARADHININKMKEIILYIYNEIPYNCYGSSERYEKWIQSFRDKQSRSIR